MPADPSSLHRGASSRYLPSGSRESCSYTRFPAGPHCRTFFTQVHGAAPVSYPLAPVLLSLKVLQPPPRGRNAPITVTGFMRAHQGFHGLSRLVVCWVDTSSHMPRSTRLDLYLSLRTRQCPCRAPCFSNLPLLPLALHPWSAMVAPPPFPLVPYSPVWSLTYHVPMLALATVFTLAFYSHFLRPGVLYDGHKPLLTSSLPGSASPPLLGFPPFPPLQLALLPLLSHQLFRLVLSTSFFDSTQRLLLVLPFLPPACNR